MTAPTTTDHAQQQPTACLLHAAIHPMDADCWATVLNWQAANDHLERHETRDAYQAAVERAMLNRLTATPSENYHAVISPRPAPGDPAQP